MLNLGALYMTTSKEGVNNENNLNNNNNNIANYLDESTKEELNEIVSDVKKNNKLHELIVQAIISDDLNYVKKICKIKKFIHHIIGNTN